MAAFLLGAAAAKLSGQPAARRLRPPRRLRHRRRARRRRRACDRLCHSLAGVSAAPHRRRLVRRGAGLRHVLPAMPRRSAQPMAARRAAIGRLLAAGAWPALPARSSRRARSSCSRRYTLVSTALVATLVQPRRARCRGCCCRPPAPNVTERRHRPGDCRAGTGLLRAMPTLISAGAGAAHSLRHSGGAAGPWPLRRCCRQYQRHHRLARHRHVCASARPSACWRSVWASIRLARRAWVLLSAPALSSPHTSS